jgi:small-conductance mechanosensitive channel
VLGPVGLGDLAVFLRALVRTQPGKQWEIGRELLRFVLAAREPQGVSLSYPCQEVWVYSPGSDGPGATEESESHSWALGPGR